MIAQLGKYIIRDLDPWEGPRVFRLTGDAAVMRYMGFKRHETVDEAYELILKYHDAPGRWLAVCPVEDPTDVLGILGFETLRHMATLSMMFRNDWKARGVCRQVGVPFVQWIFSHPGIWRVWSYVHVDNVQGQRVTERMGAVREGRLRRFEVFPNVSDEPQDCFIYSIVR